MFGRRLAVIATAIIAALGGGLATAPPAQAATYSVTVAANPSPAEVGKSLLISGKVSGGKVKDKSVTVYVRFATGTPYQKIGSPKLTSAGAYKLAWTPREGGTREFKVVKSKSGKTVGSSVVSAPVKVYDWIGQFEFYGAAAKDPGTGIKNNGGTINGSSSRGGLEIFDQAGITYPLATHQCKGIRGSVGVEEDSTDAYGTLTFGSFFSISSISVQRSHDAIGFNTSIVPDVDLKLQVETGASSASPTSSMFLPDLQFYCNDQVD